MKKNILAAAAALLLPLWAQAGEISAGSTPRSINYQGRLERDNAPITGTIHLYFRIFNAATGTGPGACGAVNQPCLWQSPEITVEATQGVFSANLDFTDAQMLYVFSGTAQKYLEVQVESDVLSPREPINSVVYAMVAKKLEDGSSVSVTTLTANYQVLLATAAGSKVGIGTNTPSQKLTVSGSILLQGAASQLCFEVDGTCMNSANAGTAIGGVTSPGASIIESANTDGAIGPMTFRTSKVTRMRIYDSSLDGRVGIGTAAIAGPMGTLDVSGAVYIGNEGLYDRDDNEVNVKENLVVEGGNLRGIGSNYISIGATPDTIIAGTNGTDHLWLTPAGNLGAGASAPASEKIYAAGNIRSNTGVRGSNVSIGAYNNTWAAFPNEVRAADNTDLLLQQSNPYYVGIGTNTPREKLHVRGTVLADYGVKSSTALFTSNVNVNGDFTANGNNKNVYLTTTTIYGTLTVTGGVAAQAGMPAYIASTQTFTGQNTFLNQLQVSSDIVTVNRIGAAVTDFDFPGGRYLQVGDNKVEYSADDTSAYLVGGSGANAKLRFYRGPVEASSVETLNGRNLAVMVEGQARTLTDANYHRVQNAALWVSTGYASTPGLFVSSMMANVGMGTTVLDPNWRLTVEGNLRISTASSPGQSYGIIFADGSSMHTAANIGSATGLSNNGDAVIQSDADLSGSGNVLLRAGSLDGFILNSGGNVGIGTVNPLSKLNVRGGDLVLGTPANPYSSNGIEDLIVGGNTVFDGALIQRSAAAVELANLIVANSVYLSTATGARTAIGSDALSPNTATRLYVKGGDINLDAGKGIRVNEATSLGWYLRANGTGSGASNTFAYVPSAIVATDIPVSIARTTTTITMTLPLSGTGDLSDHRTFAITGLSSIGTANYIPGVNAGGTAWEYKQILPVASETTILHGANSITIGIADPLIVDKGGTGLAALAQGSILYGNGGNPLSVLAKDGNATRYLSNTGASNDPAWAQVNLSNGVTATLPVANGGTGATSLTGVLRGNGTSPVDVMTGTANRITRWDAAGTGITNSNIIDDGNTINVTTRRILNVVDPTGNQDAATKKYVDDQSGSTGGRAWSKTGNIVNSGSDYMGSFNYDDVVFKTNNAIRMTLTKDGALQLNSPLGVAYGGTGANLSGTGGATSFVRQAGPGAAFTVGTIGTGDLPTVPVNKGGTGTTNTLSGVLFGGDPISALAASGASQYLRRNSANNAYEFAGLAAGDLPAHNHSAGNITSGTLAVARGGTNNTAYTSNEVIRMNAGGTAFETVPGGGVTGTYTVVVDSFPYTCSDFQFESGVLVSVGPGACP